MEWALIIKYIIGPIVVSTLAGAGWLMKKYIFTDNKFPLRKRLEREKEIKDYLVRLRDKVDADRMTIMLFHNGDHSMSGVPFNKMTMAYEAPALGLLPLLDTERDLLTSRYSDALMDLINNKIVHFSACNASELTVDMRNRGTESLYWFAIEDDTTEEPVGIMTVGFRDNQLLSDEKMEFIMERCSGSLSGKLSDSKLRKKLEVF